MKKFIFVLSMFFIFTGCGSKSVMTCSYKSTENNAKMDLSYTVKYKGENVISVKSVEKVESDDSDIIHDYKIMVEDMYAPYSDLSNYTYNVVVEGNTLTSTTIINYDKINLDDMIMIDPNIQQLIKGNKINIDLMKISYENLGLTCKK